ncbi:hypothetical protein SADUNF_Sadunf09G0039100 [Salix dunnii]|uniref:Uncharacterized protein n=1 Tax=Salix dunnii TaxID=1413687 RepID=A0A835JXI3_9ROSI|nr:hypothetical protein SADUNF_Sadunf09G0039100 [Salix dunnii]
MDNSSDTSNNSFTGKNSSALQALQKQHEEKTRKIEELKSQIDSVKLGLKKKMKEPLGDKKEVFKSLSEKYNSLREEYNVLLAEKSREYFSFENFRGSMNKHNMKQSFLAAFPTKSIPVKLNKFLPDPPTDGQPLSATTIFKQLPPASQERSQLHPLRHRRGSCKNIDHRAQ